MSHVMAPHFTTWSTGRKAAAVMFAVGGYAVLACAAVYLSGALFLILNKANPAQVRLTSIVQYWQLYAEDPPLRRRLQIAIGASAGALLVLLPASLLAAARPRRALHGDARFATPAEVARAGLLATDRPGILVGRYRGRFLSLPGQLSVMLAAPTRSGKGAGVVIPNLLNWPHSVVVLDIKGENFDVTAGYRAAHGQQVYAFSPFDDEARSHRWNPLTTVRSSPLHRVGDLLEIGQVFFPNDGSGTPSEAFFNDQARNLFLALGLLLLESPELPRTIGEMLRQASGNGRPLRDHLGLLAAKRTKERRPFSAECQQALQRLLNTSENTLSSIVATFVAPLTIFAEAIVDAATSADDFRLEDVRCRHMSIYVRIPPHRLASARPLLNLFFSQLISLNTRQLPQKDASLKLQCLVINDELAAMGRVDAIINAAPFLPGYDMRLLTIIQAMSQLDTVYGDKQARTFATNHGLQILYAPREQRDADEYSAMLGQFTEQATSRGRSNSFGPNGHNSTSRNESDQRRPLLLPQEIKELGSERLVIIMENCKPILGEKILYYRDKAFTSRLLPPPVVPLMNVHDNLAQIQRQFGDVDTGLPPPEADAGHDKGSDKPASQTKLDAAKDRLGAVLADLFGVAEGPGLDNVSGAPTDGDRTLNADREQPRPKDAHSRGNPHP